MITNLLAAIVVTFHTNVHEHNWSATLKTRVFEVSERQTWTFANRALPDVVKEARPVSQTTMLFTWQNGQWLEMPQGRTSGIFVSVPQPEGAGWFYVPHPSPILVPQR